MDIFEAMEREGHEQVSFFYDKRIGLKFIVAVHDTTLGPAAGGTRFWHYDTEADAVQDALRLSKGMTLKNAVSGLGFGGSKCVVYGDPKKSHELFQTLGRFVETMGGRVYTGEDVGLTPGDVEVMAETTRFIVGRKEKSGDPSKPAAYGTYVSIRAALMQIYQNPEPAGRKILIQGCGNVGTELSRYLHEDGAELVVTDIRPERAQAVAELYRARAVSPEELFQEHADIFSPCALGLVLTPEVALRLNVRAVAGSANNQLADPGVPELLRSRGILYAPDFVVNGGGIINISDEFEPGGYNRERAYKKVARIYDRLLEIFRLAEMEGITTEESAERVALKRLHDEGGKAFIPGAVS